MKKTTLVKIGVMILIILVCFFLWTKGKVYGGRLACYNSDGYLAEGFKCETPEQIEDTDFTGGILGSPVHLPS